ncbi:hypothetical protein GQ457_11G009160 [Hibiscus cannabinus]
MMKEGTGKRRSERKTDMERYGNVWVVTLYLLLWAMANLKGILSFFQLSLSTLLADLLDSKSKKKRRATYNTTKFHNADECGSTDHKITGVCDTSLVHVAITPDVDYFPGSIVVVHFILKHSLCPKNFFSISSKFIHRDLNEKNLQRRGNNCPTDLLYRSVPTIIPQLKFKVYYLDLKIVGNMISSSVRQALEQPLNYVRNYLVDLLEPCIRRVIYLDSDQRCENKLHILHADMVI